MQFSFSHHRLKTNIFWLPEQAHRFTGYLIYTYKWSWGAVKRNYYSGDGVISDIVVGHSRRQTTGRKMECQMTLPAG